MFFVSLSNQLTKKTVHNDTGILLQDFIKTKLKNFKSETENNRMSPVLQLENQNK